MTTLVDQKLVIQIELATKTMNLFSVMTIHSSGTVIRVPPRFVHVFVVVVVDDDDDDCY